MKNKIVILCASLVVLFESSALVNPNLNFHLNRRSKYPFGINVYGYGPAGQAALSFDFFIKQKFNIELGAGGNNVFDEIRYNYFIGVKYHVFGKSIMNTTFYIGIFNKINLNDSIINHALYIPIGVNRIFKSRLNLSAEIAYQPFNGYHPNSKLWGGLKIGYRFKK